MLDASIVTETDRLAQIASLPDAPLAMPQQRLERAEGLWARLRRALTPRPADAHRAGP
ncbi:MAG: hypothetical protein IE927_10315 [Rhodobacterales bacterium]|nr:hypothetical protein [Rhodobacterales bacterium]